MNDYNEIQLSCLRSFSCYQRDSINRISLDTKKTSNNKTNLRPSHFFVLCELLRLPAIFLFAETLKFTLVAGSFCQSNPSLWISKPLIFRGIHWVTLNCPSVACRASSQPITKLRLSSPGLKGYIFIFYKG